MSRWKRARGALPFFTAFCSKGTEGVELMRPELKQGAPATPRKWKMGGVVAVAAEVVLLLLTVRSSYASASLMIQDNFGRFHANHRAPERAPLTVFVESANCDRLFSPNQFLPYFVIDPRSPMNLNACGLRRSQPCDVSKLIAIHSEVVILCHSLIWEYYEPTIYFGYRIVPAIQPISSSVRPEYDYKRIYGPRVTGDPNVFCRGLTTIRNLHGYPDYNAVRAGIFRSATNFHGKIKPRSLILEDRIARNVVCAARLLYPFGCCRSSRLGFFQGESDIENTYGSDNYSDPRGPQHTLGPIGHIPLSIQILLRTLLFPIGAYIAAKALFDFSHRNGLPPEAIPLVLLVGGIVSFLGLVLLVGALASL